MSGVRCLIVLACAALVGAGIAGEPSIPSIFPVRIQKGIVFSRAGGETLKLDLAAPTTGGPYPAVLMLHGGAWHFGSRGDLSRSSRDDAGKPVPSAIEAVAARGYIVATADYRLAPKHKFPAQIEDARTAVRFLRANAKKFNLDPDRIAVMGFSAGGHLALLLGMQDAPNGSNSEEYADHSARVNCVVDYFGPSNLTLYAGIPWVVDAYLVPWLGGACRTDPEVYRKASPIHHVSKGNPPVLMIHGTADLVVPIIHSERLLDKFRAAGVPAELIEVKCKGHGWGGPTAAKTTAAALHFLDKQLKGKK